MRQFPFPRIHGPDYDLCIRSIQAILCRLRVLRLVVFHIFLYKKLDQFGHDHNAKIMEKVRNESARCQFGVKMKVARMRF